MESEAEKNIAVEMTPQGLGKLLFTADQVMLILENHPESIDQQILQGQLITQAEIRNMVIQQAKGGSAEAQKMTELWRKEIMISMAL